MILLKNSHATTVRYLQNRVFLIYWLFIRFQFDIDRHTQLWYSLLINLKLSDKLYFWYCFVEARTRCILSLSTLSLTKERNSDIAIRLFSWSVSLWSSVRLAREVALHTLTDWLRRPKSGRLLLGIVNCN